MKLNAQLVEKLEKALADVLIAADSLQGRKPWKTSIISVVRKLRIVRELNQRYYIAITGTQGAGKTRLLRALYGLDTTWLEDNPGRGEKVPVFVIEKDGLEAPQGAVVKVKSDGGLEEEKVEASDFRKIVVSWSDDGEDLFPLLYVPRKYFQGRSIDSVGFVLLPGFELESTQNRTWQLLMKYVLEHASGSIIVADQTRLAEHSQEQVRDVATDGKVPGSKPVIAISRTEHVDGSVREQLRARAAERFDVDPAESDRIVCTGVGRADYEQAWMGELMESMEKYVKLGLDVKATRLQMLDDIMDDEVAVISDEIKAALDEGSLTAAPAEEHRTRILDLFLRASADYRIRYEKNLRQHTRNYAGAAKKEARQRYKDEEEGFANAVLSVGRWFSTTSGEREDLYLQRIQDCWMHPSAQMGKRKGMGLLKSDWLALSDQSARYLKLPFGKGLTEGSGDVGALLGYDKLEEEGQLAPLGALSDPVVVSELGKLLRFDPDGVQDARPLENERLGDVLKLVPALTMEFLRINQGLILTYGDGLPEKPEAQPLGEFMAQLARDLPGVNTTAKTLLSTVGTILAVDVAIDGTVDTIPGLIQAIFSGTSAAGGTTAATTLGATLSMAAAGFIVAGVIGYKITQEAQRLDAAHRGYINLVIDQWAEAHVQHCLDVYDDAMDLIQRRIYDNLGRAYRLDQTVSSTDNLLRSLARLDRVRLSVVGNIHAKQLLA